MDVATDVIRAVAQRRPARRMLPQHAAGGLTRRAPRALAPGADRVVPAGWRRTGAYHQQPMAVVVVHVARGALLGGMETCQREPGVRVVERGAGPVECRGSVARLVRSGEPGVRVVERGAGPVECRGSVALGAVLRESGGQVRRAGGSIVIGLVAVPAGRAVQRVVVVDVARGTLLGGVETHQRE